MEKGGSRNKGKWARKMGENYESNKEIVVYRK